jgi:hypothetical protein
VYDVEVEEVPEEEVPASDAVVDGGEMLGGGGGNDYNQFLFNLWLQMLDMEPSGQVTVEELAQ